MSKLIILSAGHSNKPGRDRGAASGKYVEGDLTAELRSLVFTELKKLGVTAIIDGDNSIFTESINFFRKKVNTTSINLEFHWNSAGPTAQGVETIIPANPSADEIRIAERLSALTHYHMAIPLRGNKGVKTELETHHGKLAWMRLDGTAVLLEVCFISNEYEMQKYQIVKFDYAKAIAKLLYNESKGIISLEPNAIKKEVVIHKVKVNETLYSISRMYGVTVEKIKLENNLNSDNLYTNQSLNITKTN